MSDALRDAVRALKRFPGIGEKSATRLVYWLLRAPEGTTAEIARALQALGEGVQECEKCCDLTTENPCRVCRISGRDEGVLCVVEEPQDVMAFERSGEFEGRYHVLHGAISPLDGVGPDQLRIRPLLARVGAGSIREVILATNPTVEGDATALYLARLLSPLEVRVTRPAHGISVGTEIEYADSVSLARALQNRQEMR